MYEFGAFGTFPPRELGIPIPLHPGIPGRPFMPPMAILFDTFGSLNSPPPRDPMLLLPRMPLPEDPILP